MDKLRRFFSAHREAAVYVLLTVFALILLSVQSASVVAQSKGFGYSIISVFQMGVSRTGNFFSDTFNSITELRKLRSEYDQLREKIDEYRHIERDILDLQRENEHLRTLLGFSEELSRPHVAARIVAKDAHTLFGGITINKGKTHGIKEQEAVIAYSGGLQGLVGRVVEVGEYTSQILPIIDRSSYVAARLRINRYEGLVRGAGADAESVFMEFVKKRAKDETGFGDLVVTSGLSSIYPRGIYIGRVRSFEAPEWEPSLTLEIEPIVDFSRLEYVFVLKSEEEQK